MSTLRTMAMRESRELTEAEVSAISAIERACSVLLLLGCIFTIVTFCCSRGFHKPINRLVFYASFGNMMTNVGTLMSRAYLSELSSFGCQFQAFLIQMFMPADAFWTLAMAINVYLTFYRKFDAERLRRMELAYLLCCYGIPFVPAFAFIFIKNRQGDRIYGNAALWCWVSAEFDILRIATFYGPVWVTILITFFIYIRAGRTIYDKRKQLHDFHSSDPDPLSVNGEAVSTIKRTEVTVTVTTEAAAAAGGGAAAQPGGGEPGIHLGPVGRRAPAGADPAGGAYSVHISAADADAGAAGLPVPGPTTVRQTSTLHVSPLRPPNPARRRNHELNNAAWSYTKCAILFFTAILITWIPSTANRVYSVVHHNDVFAPLEFMSAFVLPLQGFWNAVIYAVTSWGACRDLLHDLRLLLTPGRPGPGPRRPPTAAGALPGAELPGLRPAAAAAEPGCRGASAGPGAAHRSQFLRSSPPRSSTRTLSSESTMELAKTRTYSADGSQSC